MIKNQYFIQEITDRITGVRLNSPQYSSSRRNKSFPQIPAARSFAIRQTEEKMRTLEKMREVGRHLRWPLAVAASIAATPIPVARAQTPATFAGTYTGYGKLFKDVTEQRIAELRLDNGDHNRTHACAKTEKFEINVEPDGTIRMEYHRTSELIHVQGAVDGSGKLTGHGNGWNGGADLDAQIAGNSLTGITHSHLCWYQITLIKAESR